MMADKGDDSLGYGYYTSKGAMLLLQAADSYNSLHKQPDGACSSETNSYAQSYESSALSAGDYIPTPINNKRGSGRESPEALFPNADAGKPYDEYTPMSSSSRYPPYRGTVSASSGRKDSSLLDQPIMSLLSNMVSPSKSQQQHSSNDSNRSTAFAHDTNASPLKKSLDPLKIKSLVQSLDNLAKKRSVSRVPIPETEIPTNTAARNHYSPAGDSGGHPRTPQDPRAPQDVRVKTEDVTGESSQLESSSNSSSFVAGEKKAVREFFPNEYRTLRLLTAQLEALKQAKETVLKQLPESVAQQLSYAHSIKPGSGTLEQAAQHTVLPPEVSTDHLIQGNNCIQSLGQAPQAVAGSPLVYSASGHPALPSGHESSGYGGTSLSSEIPPSGYYDTTSGYDPTAPSYNAAPSSYEVSSSGYEAPPSSYSTSLSPYAANQYGHEAAKSNFDIPAHDYESSRYGAPPPNYPVPQSQHISHTSQHLPHPSQHRQERPQSRPNFQQDYERFSSLNVDRENVSPAIGEPPRPAHRDPHHYSEYESSNYGGLQPADYCAHPPAEYDAHHHVDYGASHPVDFGASHPVDYGASHPVDYGASHPVDYGASHPVDYGASHPVDYGASHPVDYGASHPADYYRPPSHHHRPPVAPEGSRRSLEHDNYKPFPAPVPNWSPMAGPSQASSHRHEPYPPYPRDSSYGLHYPNHPDNVLERNGPPHSTHRDDAHRRYWDERGGGRCDRRSSRDGRNGDRDLHRGSYDERNGDRDLHRGGYDGRCGDRYIPQDSYDGRGGDRDIRQYSYDRRTADRGVHRGSYCDREVSRHPYGCNSGDRLPANTQHRSQLNLHASSRERSPFGRSRQDTISRLGDRHERKLTASKDTRPNRGSHGIQGEEKPGDPKKKNNKNSSLSGITKNPSPPSSKRGWMPLEGNEQDYLTPHDEDNKRVRLSPSSGLSGDTAVLKGMATDGAGMNTNRGSEEKRDGQHVLLLGDDFDKGVVVTGPISPVDNDSVISSGERINDNASFTNTATGKKETVRVPRCLWTTEMCQAYDEKNALFDRLACLRKSKPRPLILSATELKQIQGLATEFKEKRNRFGELYKNHKLKIMQEHSEEKLNELASKESKKVSGDGQNNANGGPGAVGVVSNEFKKVVQNYDSAAVLNQSLSALGVNSCIGPSNLSRPNEGLGLMGHRPAGLMGDRPAGLPLVGKHCEPFVKAVTDARRRPPVQERFLGPGGANKDIILKKPEENSFLAPDDCPDEPSDAPYLLGAFLKRLQQSQLKNNSSGAVGPESSRCASGPDGRTVSIDSETSENSLGSDDDSVACSSSSPNNSGVLASTNPGLVDLALLPTNESELLSQILYDIDGVRIQDSEDQTAEEKEKDESTNTEVEFSRHPVEKHLFSGPLYAPNDSMGGPHEEDTTIVPLTSKFRMIRDLRSHLRYQHKNDPSGMDRASVRALFQTKNFAFPWEKVAVARAAKAADRRTLLSRTLLKDGDAELLEVLTREKQVLATDGVEEASRGGSDACAGDEAANKEDRDTGILAGYFMTPLPYDPFI